LNGHPDSMNVYLAISCVASIFSMFSLFLILQEILKWPSYEPLLFFPYVYWVIVMPIIGICFLVRAITYRNPRNIQSPLTVKPTQN
jgi:magnesium-transporting ATPase (P-type)